MGSYDITSGITGFFSIFSSIIDILKNTVFTIGSVTFSLWALMWSLLFFSLFVNFIYRLIEGD